MLKFSNAKFSNACLPKFKAAGTPFKPTLLALFVLVSLREGLSYMVKPGTNGKGGKAGEDMHSRREVAGLAVRAQVGRSG